jgi:hypothetical protein
VKGHLETDEQMAARIAGEEAALAAWDQAAVDARIAAIEGFLQHAERVGFSDAGDDGTDGVSHARAELDQLRFGPPKVNRERQVTYGPFPTSIGQHFQSSVLEHTFKSSLGRER